MVHAYDGSIPDAIHQEIRVGSLSCSPPLRSFKLHHLYGDSGILLWKRMDKPDDGPGICRCDHICHRNRSIPRNRQTVALLHRRYRLRNCLCRSGVDRMQLRALRNSDNGSWRIDHGPHVRSILRSRSVPGAEG